MQPSVSPYSYRTLQRPRGLQSIWQSWQTYRADKVEWVFTQADKVDRIALRSPSHHEQTRV